MTWTGSYFEAGSQTDGSVLFAGSRLKMMQVLGSEMDTTAPISQVGLSSQKAYSMGSDVATDSGLFIMNMEKMDRIGSNLQWGAPAGSHLVRLNQDFTVLGSLYPWQANRPYSDGIFAGSNIRGFLPGSNIDNQEVFGMSGTFLWTGHTNKMFGITGSTQYTGSLSATGSTNKATDGTVRGGSTLNAQEGLSFNWVAGGLSPILEWDMGEVVTPVAIWYKAGLTNGGTGTSSGLFRERASTGSSWNTIFEIIHSQGNGFQSGGAFPGGRDTRYIGIELFKEGAGTGVLTIEEIVVLVAN